MNLFENYRTTHFAYNVDYDAARINVENNQLDKNILPVVSSKKAKVLEVGFGAGHVLKYLSEKGFSNIEGVEISKEMYELVKKKEICTLALVEDTVKFLDKRRKAYDCIIMFDVLEHLPKESAVKHLIAMKNSLTNNGVLLLRVPNSASPLNIQEFYSDFTHEFFYNPISMEQVLNLAGFIHYEVLPWREETITFRSKFSTISARALNWLTGLLINASRLYGSKQNFISRDILAICYSR